MHKQLLLALVLAFAALSASADTLKFYDESGARTSIDTDAITGCVRVFDSARKPLEICRLAPVTSTTIVVVPGRPLVGLGSARQQSRATARRVYRRMDRRQ